MIKLDKIGARKLMLAAQGLLTSSEKAATRQDLLAAIRRMGALQIDTIHVVARSPYFVLWSRLGNYPPVWLEELLTEGFLFEYWAHAACFLPIEDYRYYRRMMLDQIRGWRYIYDGVENNPVLTDRILTYIRENGAVRSADFDNAQKQSGGWWNWKAEKEGLEYLHTKGDLMIARREKFQRVYDLRERVLPGWDDQATPSITEVYRALTLRAVQALGVAQAAWVPDYFRLPKRKVASILTQLETEQELIPICVEGWEEPAYLHPSNLELAQNASAGKLRAERTTLLSPFDPLIWDRSRAHSMFGFDYSIECYLPAPKRKYGYFNLPILHQDALVGRLDAKAHRKEGIFEVKALYLEPGIQPDDEFLENLGSAIQNCADWHGTPQVIMQRSDPPELAQRLSRYSPRPG